MSVIAVLASLGQQTSHSLQSLYLISCNAIYYYAGFYSQFLIFQKVMSAQTSVFTDYLFEKLKIVDKDLRKQIFSYGQVHRKNFFSESQLSPIVKSNLVEITRIPV